MRSSTSRRTRSGLEETRPRRPSWAASWSGSAGGPMGSWGARSSTRDSRHALAGERTKERKEKGESIQDRDRRARVDQRLPFFAFFVVLLFFDAMVGSNSSSGAGPG